MRLNVRLEHHSIYGGSCRGWINSLPEAGRPFAMNCSNDGPVRFIITSKVVSVAPVTEDGRLVMAFLTTETGACYKLTILMAEQGG